MSVKPFGVSQLMVQFALCCRLYDLYGVLSDEVNDKDNDGGDEDVDEHRLHARVLAELHKLKASSAVWKTKHRLNFGVCACVCVCMITPRLCRGQFKYKVS